MDRRWVDYMVEQLLQIERMIRCLNVTPTNSNRELKATRHQGSYDN